MRTRIFGEHEDLFGFIQAHVPSLKEGSVLVVTSKIVALAEGRTAHIEDAAAIIRAESEWQKKTTLGNVTLKDGILMWNAGVDSSNANGKIILLPKDSFAAAKNIHSKILRHYNIRNLGVIIADSRVMPLRAGVVGIALGYAGFKGLRDYRSKKDIYGRKIQYTQTNLSDSLATAATSVMGEGDERQPLCVIEGAPVKFAQRVQRRELRIDVKDDMYRPLMKFRT
ncbi:MAG: coenzyme F420-0:L-glutamate ligase [Minisyncoccota bacterium]